MMGRNGLDIKMTLPTDADLAKMFGAVPQLKKHAVMKTVTAAGGKVVVARARQLAPRGTAADRAKRSKKQKAAANWDIELHTTIAMVNRVGDRLAFSVIGPKHPQGNKAYLNAPVSGQRKHKLWGRDVGRIFKATRNWIVQAFDETRGEQLSAMKAALTKKVDEMMH